MKPAEGYNIPMNLKYFYTLLSCLEAKLVLLGWVSRGMGNGIDLDPHHSILSLLCTLVYFLIILVL